MAMVACDSHWRDEVPVEFNGKIYVAGVDPYGFPDTAVICFQEGCKNPGTVWLEQHELDAFKSKPHKLYFTIEGGYGQVRLG